MVKCTKGQVRRLKTALRWKIPPEQHQRIQMVLLRESGMCYPACNFGSDSHLMMFAYGSVLFRENQHHAIQLSDFILDSEWICHR
jgi:hypothetical protein